MNPKIYACHSPSHKPLLEEHFLPTIPKGFDVVLRKLEQVCPSGEYRSENWCEAMENKVRLVLEALETERDLFVVSDVDVRFYDFTPSDLNDAMSAQDGVLPDLKCMIDNHDYCAGFMFVRPCFANMVLFQNVLHAVRQYNSEQMSLNQFAIQHVKRLSSAYRFNVSLLPHNSYWNIADYWDGKKNWDGQGPPPEMLVHHANYTIGIDNKMRLLETVRIKREMRREHSIEVSDPGAPREVSNDVGRLATQSEGS